MDLLKCSSFKKTKFCVYVRLEQFCPYLYFSLPFTVLDRSFWDYLEDKLAIRFDEAEDPDRLLIDIIELMNQDLVGHPIEVLYVSNDNGREAA
ncbi:hypothetical protein PP939_gp054 [Rhizobium phage RL38J1]|uniref:Uncharacterized protein n=1 Tax=Rhizobium phage RL38J1 TaxID=2663232 RepID=A0A6B9J351_9CAUD|nr:hypothetical protein PP939_gp054 [Rhizobium phage RL38J1]QGZ14002.1 hypothetical protein RL38J1_054 [Rhizobium phage RL38J1]